MRFILRRQSLLNILFYWQFFIVVNDIINHFAYFMFYNLFFLF